MVILQSVKESRNIYRCITFATQVRHFLCGMMFTLLPPPGLDHVKIHLGDYNCSVCNRLRVANCSSRDLNRNKDVTDVSRIPSCSGLLSIFLFQILRLTVTAFV